MQNIAVQPGEIIGITGPGGCGNIRSIGPNFASHFTTAGTITVSMEVASQICSKGARMAETSSQG